MIIAISAGHYLGTSGKRVAKQLDPSETREWTLNARIAEYVEKLLAAYKDVEVLRLDDRTGKTAITIQQRAKIANQKKATVYIAIHHNAGINLGSGGGTVVYHYPNAMRKASAQKLYNRVVGLTGLKGNRSTPVKETKTLYEIYAPNMPAFLIENGFMDSRTDVPIILSDAHAQKTAQGIVNFLVAEYGLKQKEDADLQPIVLNPYPVPTRTLQKKLVKMKGDDVKWVQYELNQHINAKLEVDGIFGKDTEAAVINLQKSSKGKLEVDGVVGKMTRAYLLEKRA